MKYLIAQNNIVAITKVISSILNGELVFYSVEHFTENEILITLEKEIGNKAEIFIYIELWPQPNNALIKLFFLLDLLVSKGCNNIKLIIPFIPYLRQDRELRPNSSIGSRSIAKILTYFSINKIYTFDIHSSNAAGFFECGLINMSNNEYFANKLIEHNACSKALVLAPDMGALERAYILAKSIKATHQYLKKTRKNGQIFTESLSGIEKYDNIILVDDIIDSGKTILSAIKSCKKYTNNIFICVSHILCKNITNKIAKKYPEVKIISPDPTELSPKELKLLYSQLL
ncbi:MAG: ribose-phosphate diphosphokinase [Rickettsiaceae bacterium]|nr:ribose-phosphate diphosphokinase [Rickettsiaceae bacterium]